LEYQRSIPVGETNNFFSASDRTPVLTLRTDQQRLFGPGSKLPFNAELSLGEFVDPQERDKVSRTNLDLRSSYSTGGERRFQLRVDGRFKQSFYSDDTAQYAVGYGTQATYSLGLDTALTFRYNYLEREGFTPLAIDRVGKTNLATADLSYRVLRTLKLGVQSGYDFLLEERGAQTAWQPVGVLAQWQPRNWFQMRAWPVYDPFNQLWSSVRVDMTYLPGATFVTLGARYDGFRKQWGAVNAFVDGLKWGRAKLSANLQYNGYLKRFDERHVALTYDLHCAEAILQVRESNLGFRPGREIAFFIRLKALPFDTPFGLSRRGAPLGTATGRGF
jgi:LPS-assembly protein